MISFKSRILLFGGHFVPPAFKIYVCDEEGQFQEDEKEVETNMRRLIWDGSHIMQDGRIYFMGFTSFGSDG